MGDIAIDSATGLDAILGMHNVKRRLLSTVLTPFALDRRGEPGIRAPRGVLIYGAEGCGCTFIANQLAEELDNSFGVSTWLADDLNSERLEELAFVLKEAERSGRQTFVIGVSHNPGKFEPVEVDAAGFDRMVFVPPPDWEARSFRVWQQLARTTIDEDVVDTIVEATQGWTGVDIRDYFTNRTDGETKIDMTPSVVPSTWSWLNDNRAILKSFGQRGMVDDFEAYLLRQKLI